MLTLRRLIVISRPVFYLTSLSVYLGGFAYSGAAFSWIVIAGAVFMTFFMGLIAYGINDIADRKSDALNPRKGKLDGAVLRETEVKQLMLIILISGLGWGIFFLATRRIGAFTAALAIYALACAYSLKPLRLKSRPGLDSFTNGLWAVCMFLVGYWISGPSNTLSWPPAFLLGAIGLAMMGVHALAAVADYQVDKKTGDKTIATWLGKRYASIFSSAAFATSSVVVAPHNTVIASYLLCCSAICLICVHHNSPNAIRTAITVIVFLLPFAVIAATQW